MRSLDDTTPEPFRIQFSAAAYKQRAELPHGALERLDRRLFQLADLAAFAVGYSISMAGMESMVADSEGLAVRYQVNEESRTLTVLEIEDKGLPPGKAAG